MRVAIVLVLATLILSTPAAALQGRCIKDPMGRVSCAQWENGVAVLNGLGEVVCAKGQCVRASDTDPEWYCSSVPGGSAKATITGPECEGGCESPRSDNCKPM